MSEQLEGGVGRLKVLHVTAALPVYLGLFAAVTELVQVPGGLAGLTATALGVATLVYYPTKWAVYGTAERLLADSRPTKNQIRN